MKYKIREMETAENENRMWYIEGDDGDAIATMFESPHAAEMWLKELEEEMSN